MLSAIQDVVIHNISPFLSLADIAHLARVSTKFARIRLMLFRKVTYVVVPELLSRVVMNRSFVTKFIQKLSVVCPNVNTIIVPNEMDLYSNEVLNALGKLPIKILDSKYGEYSYFYRKKEDSLVSHLRPENIAKKLKK